MCKRVKGPIAGNRSAGLDLFYNIIFPWLGDRNGALSRQLLEAQRGGEEVKQQQLIKLSSTINRQLPNCHASSEAAQALLIARIGHIDTHTHTQRQTLLDRLTVTLNMTFTVRVTVTAKPSIAPS